MAETPPPNQSPLEAPQADRLDRVIERVRSIVLGTREEGASRDASYYQRAAVVMGWLDEAEAPTEAGVALARASEGETLAHAVLAFEGSTLGRRWMAHQGVDRVAALEPSSAVEFLRAVTDLAESTIQRRASTLRMWLATLQDFESARPEWVQRARVTPALEVGPEVRRFLSSPVDSRLPTRMANWCARNGVTTFAQLICLDPTELSRERNLGRTSIRKTTFLIEDATGMDWASLRRLVRPELEAAMPEAAMGDSMEGAPAADSWREPGVRARTSWNGLLALCPDALLDRAVADLELPTRMRNFCRREGMRSLRELLAWRERDLARQPNVGRGSIQQSRAVVLGALAGWGQDGEAPRPPELNDFGDWLSLLKASFAELPATERLVLTRRAGLHGSVPTLSTLGTTIGVSRERVRQLEAKAARRLSAEWWPSVLSDRLASLAPDGARPLVEIAEADPFFEEVEEHAVTFDFVLHRLLGGALRVVEIEGEPLLVAGDPKVVAEALAAAVRATKELIYPLPLERVLDVVRRHAEQVAAGLVPYFEAALMAEFVTVEEQGSVIVAGVGQSRRNRALAVLEELREPVSLEELFEKCGGRIRLPDEVIHVARGWVTLPRHVPEFDRWGRRLVPLCIAVMHSADPGRQWSVIELFDEIAQAAQVPEWLGHWHLAGMLRLSGQVRYLGRLQVALDHDDAPEERLRVRELLAQALRRAGGPCSADHLTAAVQEERGTPEAALRLTLHTPPFVQLDGERFGLVDRDVPGGVESLAAAEQALEDELEARQRGMSPGEALRLVRDLGEGHAAWTFELVKTVARHADGLRLSRAGGIGLAEWEDTRLPTRREIVAASVDEGGGRASIASLQDGLEREFGARPHRWSVVNIGSSLGLVARGDELCREQVVSASTPPAPADVPDASAIEGVPSIAVPVLQALLAEAPGDLAALRAEALAYPAEFERARQSHPHIDPEEARAAAAASARLIDAAPDDPVARRLIWAAVRYFVETEDGESDFAVGGLDDDMDVLDAVARHLGLLHALVVRPAPAPSPAPSRSSEDAPPSELEAFEALVSVDANPHALRQQIADHLARFREQAAHFELLPLDLAEELAERLDALLADFGTLPDEHRPLVVGAARYFVMGDDHVPDLTDVLGLDDDVSVFNHVAHRIGREDLTIEP